MRRNTEFLETANLLSGTENIGLLALAVRFVVMWAGFLLGELHQILPYTPFLSEGADSICASKIASLKTIKSRVLILFFI